MHELAPLTDERQWADVRRWRKAERERLLGLRRGVEPENKDRYARSIGRELDRLIGDVSGRTISGYWPIKAEPNLMFWMEGLEARGAVGCLPVVVEPKTPLVFKQWRRGMKMVPGIWNIPTPADSPIVVPDVVLAPVLGFDEACYRLGNGGGYFDRTLAVRSRARWSSAWGTSASRSGRSTRSHTTSRWTSSSPNRERRGPPADQPAFCWIQARSDRASEAPARCATI